jgi:hypothetical protein
MAQNDAWWNFSESDQTLTAASRRKTKCSVAFNDLNDWNGAQRWNVWNGPQVLKLNDLNEAKRLNSLNVLNR